MLATPTRSNRAGERDNLDSTYEQTGKAGNAGLAIFPVLGEIPSAPPDLLPPLDTHRLYRGSTGTYGGRTPQERQPPIASRMPPNSMKGRASTTASPIDGVSYQPRLSTSSVLSTPTTSFTSWLPFAGWAQQQPQQHQQKQQQPRQLGLGQVLRKQPTRKSPADAPASDAGSSGLLGSLWRNLSGGSNPPSRPSTRASSIVEHSTDIEHLAIGFAEISGSLALATPYIKPEQMELLLAHKGTDYGTSKEAGSPPMGGGLGGWMPAGSSSHASGRSQKALPLVIASPTVLFSELELAPGESQTFSIKVRLPKSLPPSFRGRTGRVSYDLVVVAKRSMLESSAYVVRIPFLVLAYVGGSGSVDTFSIARPIQMAPDQIKLSYQDEITVSTPRNTSPSFGSEKGEHSQLDSGSKPEALGMGFLPPLAPLEEPREDTSDVYKNLMNSPFLQSLVDSIGSEMAADSQVVPSIELFSQDAALQNGLSFETSPDGCRNDSNYNIQVACRKRAPVSFSLSQDGHTVASVWLPKRVYQLGDMVTGKLDIHQESVSVYQVSIWLESVESIDKDFASYNQSRTEELTRKVYSEHHEFCRNTRTLGFSLSAPQAETAAAPSFNSRIISNIWKLRIELIIGVPGSPTASDYLLSAATPFPPVSPYHASTGPRSSVLQMPAKDTQLMQPDGGRTLASNCHPAIPVDAHVSIPNHLTSSMRNGNGRMRSATMVGTGGIGIIGKIHHQQQQQQQKLHDAYNVDMKEMQSQARASTETLQRTVRRRYDAAPTITAQTLSCTVAIQMHPSPSKLQPAGHKDTYTVDMATQRR
ncbi:Golgi membrane exchange factor (Ric1p-Rgp1p) subunit [Coemansia sp. RSA 1646]|nr:Golgi membrane exchange factor (Ric1p-Rgp1p) subunit [Coemansia sp. RSA 1646]